MVSSNVAGKGTNELGRGGQSAKDRVPCPCLASRSPSIPGRVFRFARVLLRPVFRFARVPLRHLFRFAASADRDLRWCVGAWVRGLARRRASLAT